MKKEELPSKSRRQAELPRRSRFLVQHLDEGIPVPLSGESHEQLPDAESDHRPQAQSPSPRPLRCLGEEPFLVEPSPFPGDRQQVGENDRCDLEQIDVPQLIDAVLGPLHDPGNPLQIVVFKLRVEPQLRECRPHRLSSFDLYFIVNHGCDDEPDLTVIPVLELLSPAQPEPSGRTPHD